MPWQQLNCCSITIITTLFTFNCKMVLDMNTSFFWHFCHFIFVYVDMRMDTSFLVQNLFSEKQQEILNSQLKIHRYSSSLLHNCWLFGFFFFLKIRTHSPVGKDSCLQAATDLCKLIFLLIPYNL